MPPWASRLPSSCGLAAGHRVPYWGTCETHLCSSQLSSIYRKALDDCAGRDDDGGLAKALPDLSGLESKLGAIGSSLKNLASESLAFLASLDALEEPTSPPLQWPFVVNNRTKAVHRPTREGPTLHPSTWATKCGWPFGVADFRRLRDVDPDTTWTLICEKCLPALRAERMDAALAVEPEDE